jgi:tRNA-2-methylthio-N6-dimethylallyladenosine synthase
MLAQVDEDVKAERLARLQALLLEQQRSFNEAKIGRVLPVLVSGTGRMPGQMYGRTPYLQAVHFAGPAQMGDTIELRIVGASQNSLKAERVDARVLA